MQSLRLNVQYPIPSQSVNISEQKVESSRNTGEAQLNSLFGLFRKGWVGIPVTCERERENEETTL